MATRSIKIGEAGVRSRRRTVSERNGFLHRHIVPAPAVTYIPSPPPPRSIFEPAEKNASLRLTYDGTFCQQIYDLRERARGTCWTLVDIFELLDK